MKKLTQAEAFFHETNALKGWYYQLPDVDRDDQLSMQKSLEITDKEL